MQPKDRKRFGFCVLAAAELYGREVSDPVMEVWWTALAQFDIEAVEHAFRQHIENPDVGQYMPKPADIRRLLEGSSVDGAMVAWAKVELAVRRVGTYRSVVFDDPIIHRVLHDMGGWVQLGTKTEKEWPFIGNEFRTRYIGYRTRADPQLEYPTHLIGIVEAENARQGFPIEEPTLVGAAEQAMRVLAVGTTKPLLTITTPRSEAMKLLPQPEPKDVVASSR